MAEVRTLNLQHHSGPIVVPGVMKTMLVFTILMVTGPIFLYFFSKVAIFEGVLNMTSNDSWFYSAIVAVFSVHVVLAMFIYVAWTEDDGTQKPVKSD